VDAIEEILLEGAQLRLLVLLTRLHVVDALGHAGEARVDVVGRPCHGRAGDLELAGLDGSDALGRLVEALGERSEVAQAKLVVAARRALHALLELTHPARSTPRLLTDGVQAVEHLGELRAQSENLRAQLLSDARVDGGDQRGRVRLVARDHPAVDRQREKHRYRDVGKGEASEGTPQVGLFLRRHVEISTPQLRHRRLHRQVAGRS
jgi:hypothetical protein